MSIVVRAAEEISWGPALERACQGQGITPVYQPIVDIQRGVIAGYEALTRFEGPPNVTPDKWFAAARIAGCVHRLEAACIRAALAGRPSLPNACFLSVNVGPESVGDPAVTAALLEQPNLQGVVLELTEHTPVGSYPELLAVLAGLRDRGALVAVDDAGAGYAGLQHILELRPEFLKLDRSLVDGVDRDEAKRALVDMIGTFASRIDAWVIAEGIEHSSEMAALVRLGIPLAQGYYLAKPAKPWISMNPEAASELTLLADDRANVGPGLHSVRSVLETVPWIPAHRIEETTQFLRNQVRIDVVVVLDEQEQVKGLLQATPSGSGVLAPALRVNPTTSIADAARRALTRKAVDRFLPLVCTDGAGRLMGVIRMERVLEHLAGALDSRVEPPLVESPLD
jgi:EAL domain-containing protein (putative c-di-GMP-specific phosphodiesterase class I)